MRIHGLDARQGETAFAFFVLRLARPVDRAGLGDLVGHVASIVPDADAYLAALPDETFDEDVRIIGMPWAPPDAGHPLAAQRHLVETVERFGVEEAWFFQTGTSLPGTEDELDDDDDDGDDDDDDDDDDDGDDGDGHEDDTGDLVVAADGAGAALPRRQRRGTVAEAPGALGWENEGTDSRAGALTSGEVDLDITATVSALDDDDDGDEPTGAQEVLVLSDGDEPGEDDDDEPAWTHGPPPQAPQVRFPVDGYPAILDELDWEDFGIAFKLSGESVAGEGTVLLGFHSMWLAPYGGRHRHAAVTYDAIHHAAHLWVDRFAVPVSAEQQVHHLLWIVARIDEVIPVLHARFAGATMAQKYGGLLGDTTDTLVLGGNPLLAVHAAGGAVAVDAWIDANTEWSTEEVAQMLRELAIELVTSDTPEPTTGQRAGAVALDADDDDDVDHDDDADDDVDDLADDDDANDDDASDDDLDDDDHEDDDEGDDDDDLEDDDHEHDDADDDDDDADDDADDDDDDEDRGRHIVGYAGELLAARAAAGELDRRVADVLRPVLEIPQKYERRRRQVVGVLGALRDRASVPALIRIVEDNPISSALDSIGKEDLLIETARALGAIADPGAVAVLAGLVAAPGHHHDKPRPAAAGALATCLAAAPAPRVVDEAVLVSLLNVIRHRNDGEVNAELHLSYGRLAATLAPQDRDAARARLVDTPSARSDRTATLARQVALLLACDGPADDAAVAALAPGLHAALTALDYDHDYTVRNLGLALRMAEAFPGAVDPADLVWLTRFEEPELRDRAHALGERLGHPIERAPRFDRRSAAALDDDALVRAIGELHLRGRAALIAEAGRRRLAAARPAIVQAAHDVIAATRPGASNLLDPQTEVLRVAVRTLRDGELDAETIALFDRMLRHSNYHVKWELLQRPPDDERLIAGMFHVLGEAWGWQESTARTWLSRLEGSPVFEAERRKAGSPSVPADNDDDDDDAN